MQQMREARLAAGLTQAELAARVGLKRRALGNYETGVRPIPLRTARTIEAVLGLSAGELEFPDPNPKTESA